MILYLDNSFLNRPFDNPNVTINRLEGEILFLLINLAEKDKVQLANSSVIEYENSLNPFPNRKAFVEEVLNKTKIYQNLNAQIEKRSKQLVKDLGMTAIDALHLAAAEAADVDFFITCDYNIIKKYKGNLKIIKPLDFLKLYENPNN